MASEQQIVLNSGEATQQVIVDRSQMNFATGQTYIKQENEIVEYQQPPDVPRASASQPQQVFYTTGNNIKQQTIEVRNRIVLIDVHLLRYICFVCMCSLAFATHNATATSTTC